MTEEGSSNLARSSFFFFFSEEYFLCTDMIFTFIIHNSHERKKNHSRFPVVLAHTNPFYTGKKK